MLLPVVSVLATLATPTPVMTKGAATQPDNEITVKTVKILTVIFDITVD
jgi:hypothetical protein